MSSLSPNTQITPGTATTSTTSTPVYAAFSPSPSSNHSSSSAHHTRRTLLVHQKSPLLIATPPQITRALAYSHPFISPLSKFLGLLSWSTNDPWESFLLVAGFWAVVLYGDVILRFTGPLLMGAGLILGMYSRRYSPLSSTGWASQAATTDQKSDKNEKSDEAKPTKKEQQGSSTHHKSLDEIVATLQTFTTRCNLLLDPFLTLTDFLSTQHTATTATTRPALTALFMRLLMVAPIWWALTLPPLRLVTTKRVILAMGTIALSWHSRPARVSRVILWRSKSIRKAAALITGLTFETPPRQGLDANSGDRTAHAAAKKVALNRNKKKEGIRFTFALYENQRRWLGIGWTGSMLAYERAPWTDEYLNSSTPKDTFELPEVQGGLAKWRWCPASEWTVEDDSSPSEREAEKRKRATSEGAKTEGKNKEGEGDEERGWIYYDNKWTNGRRGVDGWGRYTRRRKWARDAELVETTPSMDATPIASPRLSAEDADKEDDDRKALPKLGGGGSLLTPDRAAAGGTTSTNPPSSTPKHVRGNDSLDSTSSADYESATPSRERRSWFRRRRDKSRSRPRSGSVTPSVASTTGAASVTSTSLDDEDALSEKTMTTDRGTDDDEGYVPMRQTWERAWPGAGDDVGMELG